jgi:phenylalanyl-tRNA synthetase beta chain
MIISYQWLLQYLPENLSVKDLDRILTSIGLEVEAIETAETIKGGLEGLVIGQVLTSEKHPNADKLKVTTVDIGTGEPLHIVCGAPNVAGGQKVIVAPVGTMVHPIEGEPFLIKKAKIRGEESAGMICAEDEIGLGKSHNGILVLPEDAPIGGRLRDYFNLPSADHAIHVGLTPNRSDAMSHIGVARDVCAYQTHHEGKKVAVRLPADELPAKQGTGKNITVNVETDACARYMGISISNVKVGPSPDWLQQRLKTIEVRPINNIVDITNYVLHEYGQPLHAFDADKIKEDTINVRFVKEGTSFTGLDNKERKLRAEDIMICDGQGPIGMGGVFGGLDSGISEGTTNVFLESAYFDAAHIRRTSLHHNLRTDAATHFEKGVDINNLLPALKRAATMIVEITGGVIASDITDIYKKPLQPVTVSVTYDYIQKLSGKAYSQDAIKGVLTALGFVIQEETGTGLTLQVPSNKTDVLQPADIVEEILRIDGLDNVQIPERISISLGKSLADDRKEREQLSDLLCGMGFQEIVTNSIVNSKFYPERTDLVRMLNSLNNDLDVMRPSMLESGLEVIQYNANRKSQDLRLFEIGRIYSHTDGKYVETPQAALWVTGNTQAQHWNQKPANADIFYLKGVVNNLLLQSGIKNTTTTYEEAGESIIISWKWKNQLLCKAYAVTNKRLQEFEVKQPVYFAAIEWQVWLKAAAANKIRYAEVPKFPAVSRDLAIILDSHTTYQQVHHTTEQLKLDALKSIDLFDVFESEKLGKNKKSYALSYIFQLQDRTLTDVEIDAMMKQLMGAYKEKLQAQIRE